MLLSFCAGAMLWVVRGGTFTAAAVIAGRPEDIGERWGDLAQAYGGIFLHFVLMLIAGVVLSVSIRRRQEAYSDCRQRLGAAS